MRWSWLILILFWSLAPARWASAGPADGLLRLVAAESDATLAVEDLRGRALEVAGSPLFEGLLRLQPVRAWMASEPFRKVAEASRGVQEALGVPLTTIRDELLGDAVVLTLQSGPSGKPEQSRGLLLVKPRDRPLLERLVKVINDAQFGSGELAGVPDRTRGAVKYSARLFKAAGRAPEFYVVLDDGTFAWSNSEAMILGVIDRKVSGLAGLGDDPEFRRVRKGLPDRPLASLFVNPGALRRAMAEDPRAASDRLAALLARYVGAIGRLGLALEWRDGIFLHSSETVAPEKLDPWLKDWLTSPSEPASLPALVSPATVAVASANIDFRAVSDAIRALVPEDDRPALENFLLGLRGILMGRDPLTEVLPRLGPGAVLAIEIEPDRALRRHFPLVGVVGWSVKPGEDDLASPIDNAMRTLLAFYGFDPKRRMDRLRVEPRAVGDTRMTVLTDGLRTLLAYRVDRDRLVVGNSPEAVARFGTGRPPSAISEIRARSFPEAGTFAIVDLIRLSAEIRSLRAPIARALAARSKRPIAAVDGDLGDLIAVADLFRAATFTATASPDGTEVRRKVGLTAR
jgi:hypothetical protein